MKKWTVLILGLIVAAAAGVTALNRSGSRPPAESGTGNRKIDRLFHELGILQVPARPVLEGAGLVDLAGNRVFLSDFRGKTVFLNFWPTWCPPCRKEMPAMETLHRRLENEPFAVVSVRLKESAEKVGAFFTGQNLTFQALLDPKGDAARQFGVAQIPTTFILSKQGEIIGKALGPRRWGGNTSVDLFKALSRAG